MTTFICNAIACWVCIYTRTDRIWGYGRLLYSRILTEVYTPRSEFRSNAPLKIMVPTHPPYRLNTNVN